MKISVLIISILGCSNVKKTLLPNMTQKNRMIRCVFDDNFGIILLISSQTPMLCVLIRIALVYVVGAH